MFNVTIGRAAWEACSATLNLGTNSAFALGPRKTMENLDRVGRSQDLPEANCLPASSLALNPRALTLVPIFAVVFFFVLFFLSFLTSCFYNYCYVDMIRISTKLCTTHVEGINANMNKYIRICDSSIIVKFGSLLQFGKIRLFYEVCCLSNNKDYVSQLRSE
jgi:hypothetical protein